MTGLQAMKDGCLRVPGPLAPLIGQGRPTRLGWVWLFSVSLIAAAAALYWLGIRGLPALPTPVQLPWWMVGIGFGLAEILVVHFQLRRDTHSFSLSELPLVLGLYFVRPEELLLALVAGSGTALLLHRRQPVVKLVFNLGNLTLTTGLAILLFQLVVSVGSPLGPAGWAATFVAAISADVLSLVTISLVVWLASARPPAVARLFGAGTVATFFNSCLALVTATILWFEPDAVWIPFVLAGLMFVAYRIYGAVLQKHESLEVLMSRRAGSRIRPTSMV